MKYPPPQQPFWGATVDGPTSSDATGSAAKSKVKERKQAGAVVSCGIPIPIQLFTPIRTPLRWFSTSLFFGPHQSRDVSNGQNLYWIATSLRVALLRSLYTNLRPQLITIHWTPVSHAYLTRKMTNRSANRLPCATSFGPHHVGVEETGSSGTTLAKKQTESTR